MAMGTVGEEPSEECGCEDGKKKSRCECQSDTETESSGVDSSDDESDEELNRYLRQIRETEGFHVDERPPNTTLWGGIQPWYVEDHVKECTLFAINDYNMKNENANLELVEIVKVNAAPVRGLRYYITFVAQDSSGEKRNYQTIVWDGISELHVRLFRPEPVKKDDPKKLRLDKKSGEIAP